MEIFSIAAGIAGALTNVVLTILLASRQAQVIKRFQWLTERPALFRTVLASLGGVISLVLAYFFLFDRVGTGGWTDVAGMLNANQGVLTLVGLVIAGMTVIISVVGRESVYIEQRRQQTKKLNKRVRLALDETFHNLVHVAQILGPDGTRIAHQVPQVSFLSLEALMRDPAVERLHDSLLDVGSTILRFQDYMHGIPVKNSFTTDLDGRQRRRPTSLRPVADGTVVVPNSYAVREAERRAAHNEKLTRTLHSFALHCLRLIEEIDVHHHTAVCEALQPNLRAKLCEALRCGRRGAHYFLSSDPKVNGRSLRANNHTLLVWSNDDPEPVHGVEVIEVGQIVYDMLGSDGH